jgi:hypothetical protein
VTETQLSPVQLQEPPGAPAAVPRPPQADVRPSRWTGGRIATLVIGALLALVALALLGGGGTALWADLTQREGGYVTTGVHEFSSSGSALATEPTHLGSPGVGWLYSPGLLGKVRIRVTPVSAGPALFVGIGRSTDVDRYLAGVGHTVISDYFGNKVEAVGGGTFAISSRNAALLGRFRHRPRPADAELGSARRVVDRRRDECRRAARDRGARGPRRPHACGAVDRHRVACRRGGLSGGRRAPDRGCDPRPPRQPGERRCGSRTEFDRRRNHPIRSAIHYP